MFNLLFGSPRKNKSNDNYKDKFNGSLKAHTQEYLVVLFYIYIKQIW